MLSVFCGVFPVWLFEPCVIYGAVRDRGGIKVMFSQKSSPAWFWRPVSFGTVPVVRRSSNTATDEMCWLTIAVETMMQQESEKKSLFLYCFQ